MLEFLRRSVKTWVMKIVLLLLVISFGVFWNIGDVFIGGTSRTVASVGDSDVETELFRRAIRREQARLRNQRKQNVTLAEMRKAGLDRTLMARMIRDAAMIEELGSLKLGVPAKAIQTEILGNKRFHAGNNGFSGQVYREVLSQNGYTPTEFEQYLRYYLGQRMLVNAMGIAKTALPDVPAMIAKWQGEQRVVTMLSLTPDTAKDPGKPTDADLKAFFEENKARFREPERRWGKYVIVDPKAIAKTMVPPDTEVEKLYKKNVHLYTKAATRTVEQLLFKTESEAAAAAKKMAEDKATWAEVATSLNKKPEDTGIGTVTADKVPATTAKAIFALDKPGIAGPVKVAGGWALFNVTKVFNGSVTPLEKVKDKIAAQIALSNAMTVVPKRAAAIEEIRADGATMEEIAKRAKLPLVSFQGLSQNGTVAEGEVPGLASDKRFLAELKAAAIGQERDVIELANGSFVLVMVDKVVKAYMPKLDDIKEKVITAWAHEQRMAALEARATTLILKHGADGIAKVAEVLKKKTTDMPPLARRMLTSVLPADTVDRLFSSKKGDIMIARVRGNQAVVVAAVKEIRPVADATLKSAVASWERNLTASVASDQIEMLGRALEKRHGVQVKMDDINSLFQRMEQTRGGS